MDRWIDTDTIGQYYRSILLVILTTDSIDPLVKDFFFLIDSINYRSQNPCQIDDHLSMGSHSTDCIDPSVKNRFPSPHFSKCRKNHLHSWIIGRAKYDGLKGLCQKICCSKTVIYNTFRIILVFYAAFYWRYTVLLHISFFLTARCNRSFDTVPFYRCYI